jgi:hypothetical protein
MLFNFGIRLGRDCSGASLIAVFQDRMTLRISRSEVKHHAYSLTAVLPFMNHVSRFCERFA